MSVLPKHALCAFLVGRSLLGCAEVEDPALEDDSDVPVDIVPYNAPDVGWVMRSQMTASTYLTEKAKWEESYELRDISAYVIDGVVRYAAIWETGLPNRLSNHNVVSESALETLIANEKALGYRMVHIEPFEQSGVAHFAVIFEQTAAGIDQQHTSKLPAANLQSEFAARSFAGYRLISLEGYTVGGLEYYSTVYDTTPGPAQRLGDSMTLAEYSSTFNTNSAQGYRLTHISAYKVGSVDQYAAVFDKTTGPGFTTSTMTAKQFQHNTIDYYLQGYHPTEVDGFYSSTNEDKYVPIFEVQPNAQGGSYCKNGYCFNLDTLVTKLQTAVDGANTKWGFEARRGLQVVQKADGVNRTFLDPPSTGNFTVHERFNPASVGKTLTAIALQKLLNEQNISVNTAVWTYLPSTWVIPATNKLITFAEILGHKSGLRSPSSAWNYTFADVKAIMEATATGPKSSVYDNINYGVARLLVARLAGENWSLGGDGVQRFVNYINSSILAPLGIYNGLYKSTGTPTLFYENPPLTAGTDFGDWTPNAGVAGPHLTLHELAVFSQATFAGLIVPSSVLTAIKNKAVTDQFGLGWGDRGPDGVMTGAYPDGTKCLGKGGNFPGGSQNLNTEIISCDNGLSVMVMGNSNLNVEAAFMAAMKASFTKLVIQLP